MTTPILGLQELVASQSQPHIPINTALRVLEASGQISVLAQENDPPLSPVDGDRYIVGDTPTAEWVGHERELAVLIGGGWTYLVPLDGWIAYDIATAQFVFFDSTVPAWSFLVSRGIPLIESSVDFSIDSIHNGAKVVIPDGLSPGIVITVSLFGTNALSNDHTTTIVNLNSNAATIEMEVGSPQDILLLFPDGPVAGVTIDQYGSVTLTKVSSTTWLVVGSGVTAI